LMEQVCAGMSAAHQSQVIHRDLKPSNVLVLQVTGSPRPIVKILDFGLGKSLEAGKSGSNLTREGVLMGTLCFSAPEQLEGGEVDARADIYSLGALGYFLLSGRPPYRDEGFRATLFKQLSQPPDPLDRGELSPAQARAVEAVLHKAMSPHSEERHPAPAERSAAPSPPPAPGAAPPDPAP